MNGRGCSLVHRLRRQRQEIAREREAGRLSVAGARTWIVLSEELDICRHDAASGGTEVCSACSGMAVDATTVITITVVGARVRGNRPNG